MLHRVLEAWGPPFLDGVFKSTNCNIKVGDWICCQHFENSAEHVGPHRVSKTHAPELKGMYALPTYIMKTPTKVRPPPATPSPRNPSPLASARQELRILKMAKLELDQENASLRARVDHFEAQFAGPYLSLSCTKTLQTFVPFAVEKFENFCDVVRPFWSSESSVSFENVLLVTTAMLSMGLSFRMTHCLWHHIVSEPQGRRLIYKMLKTLSQWGEARQVIRLLTPQEWVDSNTVALARDFPRCLFMFLDGTPLFSQRSSDPALNRLLYNSKHRSQAYNVFVVVYPNGRIGYTSEAQGGSMVDVTMLEESKFFSAVCDFYKKHPSFAPANRSVASVEILENPPKKKRSVNHVASDSDDALRTPPPVLGLPPVTPLLPAIGGPGDQLTAQVTRTARRNPPIRERATPVVSPAPPAPLDSRPHATVRVNGAAYTLCVGGDKGYRGTDPPDGWRMLITKSGENAAEAHDGKRTRNATLECSPLIASHRSVVERVIGTLKSFEILQTKTHLTHQTTTGDIFRVICLLFNHFELYKRVSTGTQSERILTETKWIKPLSERIACACTSYT